MFRRFCQFPYCGDYDGLSPDPKGEQKAEDAECAEIRVESTNVFVNSKYHCPLDNSDDSSIVLSPGGEQASECKQAPEYIGERRPFGYQILDKFIYTNIYIPHRVLSPFKHWTFNSEVKPFDPSSYAFSSFRKHLMHHTDMYMLGNRYGVTKLKDMALYKCWRMLRSWPLFEVHETLPIIAATLTCTKPGDRLRELFAHFIASLSSAPPPLATHPSTYTQNTTFNHNLEKFGDSSMYIPSCAPRSYPFPLLC